MYLHVYWHWLDFMFLHCQLYEEQSLFWCSIPTLLSIFFFSCTIIIDISSLQFHTSLTKLAGSTFSLMTLGAWPLRHYLHPEAHKHKLTLQRYLSHYLDLTKEFAKSFPSLEAPASLQVMADSILVLHVHMIVLKALLQGGA